MDNLSRAILLIIKIKEYLKDIFYDPSSFQLFLLKGIVLFIIEFVRPERRGTCKVLDS